MTAFHSIEIQGDIGTVITLDSDGITLLGDSAIHSNANVITFTNTLTEASVPSYLYTVSSGLYIVTSLMVAIAIAGGLGAACLIIYTPLGTPAGQGTSLTLGVALTNPGVVAAPITQQPPFKPGDSVSLGISGDLTNLIATLTVTLRAV